jgi:hypothetical protein
VLRANLLVSFVMPDMMLLLLGFVNACFAWLVLIFITGQVTERRAKRVTSSRLVLPCQLLVLHAATAGHYPFLRTLVHKIHKAHSKSWIRNCSAILAPALSSVPPLVFHHPSILTPSSAIPPKARSQSFEAGACLYFPWCSSPSR